jgi:hypothetical protein
MFFKYFEKIHFITVDDKAVQGMEIPNLSILQEEEKQRRRERGQGIKVSKLESWPIYRIQHNFVNFFPRISASFTSPFASSSSINSYGSDTETTPEDDDDDEEEEVASGGDGGDTKDLSEDEGRSKRIDASQDADLNVRFLAEYEMYRRAKEIELHEYLGGMGNGGNGSSSLQPPALGGLFDRVRKLHEH